MDVTSQRVQLMIVGNNDLLLCATKTKFFSSTTKLKSFVGVIGHQLVYIWSNDLVIDLLRVCTLYNAMIFLLSGHKPSNIWTRWSDNTLFHTHMPSSEFANRFVWFWSCRPGKGRVGKDFISDLGEIPFILIVGGANNLALLAFVLNSNQINSNCPCLELCLLNKLKDQFSAFSHIWLQKMNSTLPPVFELVI